MFCPKCGSQLPDNAAFCNSCGNKLAAAPAAAAAPKHAAPAAPYNPAPAPVPAAKKKSPKGIIMGIAAVAVVAVAGVFAFNAFSGGSGSVIGGSDVYVMQSESSEHDRAGIPEITSTDCAYDEKGNLLTHRYEHKWDGNSVNTVSLSGYDEYGTPSTCTLDSGYSYNIQTTSRDKDGRPLAITVTDEYGLVACTATYTRNENGTTKSLTYTPSNGDVSRFDFDEKGRLASIYSGSYGGYTITIDHSKGTITNGEQVEKYELDSHGYATNIGGGHIEYTYDSNGCPIEETAENGIPTKYTWAKVSDPSPAALARFNARAGLGKYIFDSYLQRELILLVYAIPF